MRLFIAFLLMAAAAFAHEGGIMEARTEYVSCDVEYTKDWLAMREGCAGDADVPVFDSSGNVDAIEGALADMKDAASADNHATFGVAALKLGGESLKLVGEVVKDAFDHKNAQFFSCVRAGEIPLKEDQEDCHLDALSLEKEAVKDAFEEEISAGEGKVEEFQSKGLGTSGMEDVLGYGEELVDDVDAAYGSGDRAEIRAIHHRHFRLAFLFRAEAVLSVVRYAKPVIEAGNNDNKEEILESTEAVEEDIEDLIEMCEYSDDVSDEYAYVKTNAECWDEGVDILEEFNDIGELIREGA